MKALPYEKETTRKDGHTQRFVIRQCGPEDYEAAMALQEEIRQSVNDANIFVELTPEELEESLRLDFICCAEAGGRMAGLTAMVVNRATPRHTGNYLGYTEEQLKKTVVMEASFISSDFRGYGLQQIFFSLREEAALELGAEEALTTISPDNEYSLNNALKSGYEVALQAEMYGGYLRNIMRKRLRK